jgi:PadR family transcriptional regulator, regulatory protein PadR
MRRSCPKVIIENFFEPCLLFLLLQKPSYGYEIKANLDQKCGCQANIGNLYRCLARLEKAGHVTKQNALGQKGPERIVYHITTAGRALLAEWMAELETEAGKLNKLITNYKKTHENH